MFVCLTILVILLSVCGFNYYYYDTHLLSSMSPLTSHIIRLKTPTPFFLSTKKNNKLTITTKPFFLFIYFVFCYINQTIIIHLYIHPHRFIWHNSMYDHTEGKSPFLLLPRSQWLVWLASVTTYPVFVDNCHSIFNWPSTTKIIWK